ncbi:MAG: endonuclease [bacterium]
MKKIIFISLLLCTLVLSSEVLFPGITGEDLIDSITANYKSYSNLGYDDGRDVLYGTIDNDNNYLTGVYTGYTIYLDPSADPSSDAYSKGINCEHTWPQSLGASGLAKGDLHHLYPTREEANSARGSLPFDEIDDNYTDKWFYDDQESTSKPTSDIDLWSEVYYNYSFEPREDHKGNTARSMYYFYTMYRSNYIAEDSDESWWNSQKDVLFDWHYQDLVDSREIDRTNDIGSYQEGKPNPFVIDTTLIRRAYYPHLGVEGTHTAQSSIDIRYSSEGIVIHSEAERFTADIYTIHGSSVMRFTGESGMLVNAHQFPASGKYILIVSQDHSRFSRIITILK